MTRRARRGLHAPLHWADWAGYRQVSHITAGRHDDTSMYQRLGRRGTTLVLAASLGIVSVGASVAAVERECVAPPSRHVTFALRLPTVSQLHLPDLQLAPPGQHRQRVPDAADHVPHVVLLRKVSRRGINESLSLATVARVQQRNKTVTNHVEEVQWSNGLRSRRATSCSS